LEAIGEFGSNGGDTILSRDGEGRLRLSMWVAEDNPEAGTINIAVAGADGACKLRDFQARLAEQIRENAPGVVN
jgi:hypothetical protein